MFEFFENLNNTRSDSPFLLVQSYMVVSMHHDPSRSRYWSVAVREDDRENSAGNRVGPLRTPSNRRKEPSIITRSQQEGYAHYIYSALMGPWASAVGLTAAWQISATNELIDNSQ
jgi:hypothetical protein